MNITRDSRLKDILAEYPQIKEKLTEISPKFSSGHVGEKRCRH